MKIKTIGHYKNHTWWYKVGAVYDVREYPFRATSGATVNSCYCSDCLKYRQGKKLYKMYEDIKTGGIIPQKYCVIIGALDADQVKAK